jgi:hypothetical protein
MSRKLQKINNTEEMMDALVEDYFRYDELAQMETEAIRHNITGSDSEVLEYRELDEVPKELISNVDIDKKKRISDQPKLITKKWYKDSEFILMQKQMHS